MPKGSRVSLAVIRRAENVELSLGSLEAIAEIRAWLDGLEREAMKSARQKGATLEDIATALGLSTQTIWSRFRVSGEDYQVGPGRPRRDPLLGTGAVDGSDETASS
jgi:hypothetical protein